MADVTVRFQQPQPVPPTVDFTEALSRVVSDKVRDWNKSVPTAIEAGIDRGISMHHQPEKMRTYLRELAETATALAELVVD